METIRARYQVTCASNLVEAEARDVCYEQTVETPAELIRSESLRRRVVGRVVEIRADENNPERHEVTIDFNAELAGTSLSRLLNLLYGNISIKKHIRLLDAHLPNGLLNTYTGPNHGVDGLRRMIGVWGRPLLATALKPRGSSIAELATIASAFARGGGDIVKDDHNLADDSFSAFRERVERIQDAVELASDSADHRCLYLPHLMVPHKDLERCLDFLARRRVAGVLMCPFLVGLDVMRLAAAAYPFFVMAHPALSGTFYQNDGHGIAPGFLLGTICRLAGADATIFPNYGGRFSLTREECLSISEAMRKPLGRLPQGFPTPAGGMNLERLPQMGMEYGADAIFLIGGALLTHSSDVASAAAEYLEVIREAFQEERRAPEPDVVSSCDWGDFRQHPSGPSPSVGDCLTFDGGKFQWAGRPPVAYKSSTELPFSGVSRHELIGKYGERTAFELRYFEIAPGGFTSLEKHRHTHTIICVRGHGTLRKDGMEIPLRQMDIAYIDSMQVHQLRNDSDQPFGFFCIVDRDRDRPMKP